MLKYAVVIIPYLSEFFPLKLKKAYAILNADPKKINITEDDLMGKLKIGVFGAYRGQTMIDVLFMHPDAEYPDIRRISQAQHDEYARARGFDSEKARRFLGHLLK